MPAGHTLLVPSQSASTEAVRVAVASGLHHGPRGRTFYYTAKKGDRLGVIAVRYGVTAQELKAWNGISSDVLAPGQKVRVTSDVVPVRKAGGRTKRAVATKGAGNQSAGAKSPAAKPVAAKNKPWRPTSGGEARPALTQAIPEAKSDGIAPQLPQ